MDFSETLNNSEVLGTSQHSLYGFSFFVADEQSVKLIIER